MEKLSASDLVINPDGSAYHLNLLPEDVADMVITVGDPDRVAVVSKHFDTIEIKKGKREFITHTGRIGQKRITVISTGIGTDNIDIVLNELDALVNIDFQKRTIHKQLRTLDIIRIGTSGAVQDNVPMGTILASSYGIGLDALMHYYQRDMKNNESRIHNDLQQHFSELKGIAPYVTAADPQLLSLFGEQMEKGMTVTAPGFYAPQGRMVRAKNAVPNFIAKINTFRSGENRITNLEMETAGIYALATVLGHRALSINAILASRVNLQFSTDPNKIVEKAIQMVLAKIA